MVRKRLDEEASSKTDINRVEGNLGENVLAKSPPEDGLEFKDLTLVRRDDADTVVKVDGREVAQQSFVDGESRLRLAGVDPRMLSTGRLNSITNMEKCVRREKRALVPGLKRLLVHIGSVREARFVEGGRGEG